MLNVLILSKLRKEGRKEEREEDWKKEGNLEVWKERSLELSLRSQRWAILAEQSI